MNPVRSPFYIKYLLLLLPLAGCGNNKPRTYDLSAAQSDLPAAGTGQATLLLKNYFGLKDALILGNSREAGTAAGNAKAALLSLLQDSSAITPSPGTDTMLAQLDKILQATDPSCEHQRIYFQPLSSSLYSFLKQIGLRHVMVYRQYCPMALNERGGSWLSPYPDIENPYFGDKMLTCGELTDTLQ